MSRNILCNLKLGHVLAHQGKVPRIGVYLFICLPLCAPNLMTSMKIVVDIYMQFYHDDEGSASGRVQSDT